METRYNSGTGIIELVEGSITDYHAEAIVIPANPDLEFSGFGVQGYIAAIGGMEIFDEAEKIGSEYAEANGATQIHDMHAKVPLSSAHLTSGGRLPAKHVVHSVALSYNPQEGVYCDPEIISKSTNAALKLGESSNLISMGFAALGTGLYRVPIEKSIEAMVSEFELHLSSPKSLRRLGIVLFGDEAYARGSSYIHDRASAD